ncbi:MAG: ADP-ribosylation factor-like protein [Candidatus Hermodarchaeota archaeon]
MNNFNNIDSTEDSIKILLIGLDNGGKTSILKCLKGIKGISAYNSPSPTRGLEIERFEALDSKYAIWDLGGQQLYRDEYFDDIETILKGTKKIIYVFDVQDVKRYQLAIAYLQKMMEAIKNLKDIDFSIFLHKFDPDLEFNQELNEIIIDGLIEKIKGVIPPNFPYSLHKTSIYAIFEKSKIN